MKIILFIDALDPHDVRQYCPEMAADMAGEYDVGVPRVTPNTVSQAMTGLPPSEMQMLRSTPHVEPGSFDADDGPHDGQRRVGIHPYDNILTDLDAEDVRVFQYGTPFCASVELENGDSFYDEMTDDRAPSFMNFASPPTSFMDDDWDLVADSYIDDTVLEMTTLKQLTRQDTADVLFLGYKHIDHATHWYAPDIKESLIQVLYSYIKEFRDMGHDVMWWSDHGSTRKTEVFRINQWLREQGYLALDIAHDLKEQMADRGLLDPDTDQFAEQLTLGSPFVEIDWDETVAWCGDAFDAQVDAHPDADDDELDQLVRRLASHPAIADAWRKADYLDPDGDHYDSQPEIIVKRGPGVLVTGNVHPDAATYHPQVPADWQDWPEDNMGMRPGVHSQFGCYGGDLDNDTDIDAPHELRDLMWAFIDPDSIGDADDDPESDVTQREDIDRDQLEALGYV